MRPVSQLPIIPHRLVFTTGNINRVKSTLFSYSIDEDENFQYLPFFSDFGPLSLLQIHRFCALTNKMLAEHEGKVQFCTGNYSANVANACLLLASYLLIEKHMSVEDSLRPVRSLLPSLKPYRDASSFPSTYDLTVQYCIEGLNRAIELGWYKPDEFDAEDWGKYEQVENGDMNWLIPGKLLAFASPYSTGIIRGGWRIATPGELVPVFKRKKINHVVRLCQKFYDEEIFKKAGIKHTELYFLDGSTPTNDILNTWLKLIEGPDVVALHCKAGLGRTGTLAACYMIKNFGFTGNQAIGWIRICRPGSIIGPQQKYVIKYYEKISAPPKPIVTTTPTKSKPGNTTPPPNVHTPTKTLRNALSVQTDFKSKTRGARKNSDSGVTDVSLTPKQPRKYNRPRVPMTPKK